MLFSLGLWLAVAVNEGGADMGQSAQGPSVAMGMSGKTPGKSSKSGAYDDNGNTNAENGEDGGDGAQNRAGSGSGSGSDRQAGSVFLGGFFATYADLPIYDTLPSNCTEDQLTDLATAFGTATTSGGTPCISFLASSDPSNRQRDRRFFVADILPYCDCVGALNSAEMYPCFAELVGLSGPASVLSISQLGSWCAAGPYVYSEQTGGYGFVMNDDPNSVTIAVSDDGSGAEIDVVVNFPTIPDTSALAVTAHTGGCTGASDEYLGDGASAISFLLLCSGGVCSGGVNLSYIPDVSDIGSIIIRDTINPNSMTVEGPKFLCATLVDPDADPDFRIVSIDDDGAEGGESSSSSGKSGGKSKGMGMGMGMGKKKLTSYASGIADSYIPVASDVSGSSSHSTSFVVVGILGIALLMAFVARRSNKQLPHGGSPERLGPDPLFGSSVAALSPTGRLADEEIRAKLTFDHVGESSSLLDQIDVTLSNSKRPNLE